MNRTRIAFFTSLAVTTSLAYSLTLPATIAYNQTTERQNASYEDSVATRLLQAKAKLLALQEQLDETKLRSRSQKARASTVPFYSQFADIADPNWQKVGCGIASLAMIIDYYKPAVAPDRLLTDGIANGAYIESAGWSHAGLIALAQEHGLVGEAMTLYEKSNDAAFIALDEAVAEGPVMVSVHYTFEPTNPIPHLAVITDVTDDTVYYNDPAEVTGGGEISKDKFLSAWKKRYIAIRPTT